MNPATVAWDLIFGPASRPVKEEQNAAAGNVDGDLRRIAFGLCERH